jgi:hypothetical protein
MSDNHKHLANTLIEIPIDTIARWNKDAQDYSMERFHRVQSAVVELYMKLSTDKWRADERNSILVAELEKTIKLQSQLIEHLKMQKK